MGDPAGQIQVRASGWGPDGPARGVRTGRTADDGQYSLDVPPEYAYIVAVSDDTWAAQSLMNVVVHEGQTRAGSISRSSKERLLRGQITEGPGRRPSAGAMVMLNEKGESASERLSRLERQQGSAHASDDEIRRRGTVSVPGRPRPIHGSRHQHASYDLREVRM